MLCPCACCSRPIQMGNEDVPDDDATVDSLPRSHRPNLNKPRYDQSTYWGRAQHFFTVTNPFNLLCTSTELEESKALVEDYMQHDQIPAHVTVAQLWQAKHVFDSAFHPETHEPQFIVGRMSAQVPANMVITGCMMSFYRTAPAVIFWQWINQSFNAVVNYTNRSGDAIDNRKLAMSYGTATSAAVATALGMNSLTKSAPPLVGRLVPFVAVAAANAVNIPLMRRAEMQQGIAVLDDNGRRVGQSTTAAKWAIGQVLLSRVGMAAPGMVIPPIIFNSLETKAWYKPYARFCTAPLQVLLCGCCLSVMTPLCCALFPQQAGIAVSSLEPEVQQKIRAEHPSLETVYYNKGL